MIGASCIVRKWFTEDDWIYEKSHIILGTTFIFASWIFMLLSSRVIRSCIIVILLIVSYTTVYGYQQQGFSSYSENGSGINFSCSTQCLLLLWPLSSNDILDVAWSLIGQGQIGYGFLIGQQIYPGKVMPITDVLSYQFDLYDNQVYSQIPKDQAQLVLIIEWNAQWTDIWLDIYSMGMGDTIAQIWTDFRKNETLMPYSINLRYGIKLLGVSLVKVLYIIFILGGIYILITPRYKKKRRQMLFYRWIALILFLWIRNMINWIDRTVTWLQNYAFVQSDDKVFFDLGDYIVFADKMRDVLKLDEKLGQEDCNIMSYGQWWPFINHLEAVYIKPCEPIADKSLADYIIYYHQEILPEDMNKKKLLEFNGSVVLDNR